jgi:hypothetical protein
LGGLIGVALGAAIAHFISGINLGSTPITAAVTPDSILLTTLFSLAVGLIIVGDLQPRDSGHRLVCHLRRRNASGTGRRVPSCKTAGAPLSSPRLRCVMS